MKPRVVIFDIEARKRTDDLNPRDRDAAWADLRNGRGGASAIALYDTSDDFLHLYDDFRPGEVASYLEAADLVVGFFSERFDIPLVEGLSGRRLRLNGHYDICEELARVCAMRNIKRSPGDLTLDRLSKKNLGRGKIEHGANAAELAKRGRYGQLFNYCADDVRLTRDLFALICRDGGILNSAGTFISFPTVIPERIKSHMVRYL